MGKFRGKLFSNYKDIDDFFKSIGNKGFVDWFNSNIAGRGNWGNVRLQSQTNWNKVWSNGSTIFNKDTFNLIEFLCINSIIMNETGGTFRPLSENLGGSGHPGISYAFDKISGTKISYNTMDTNKSAYDLFNDSKFKAAHITKPLGNLLKDTNDSRWNSEVFPQGFTGNISSETSTLGKTNTFLTEADFVKFRGRGYIQTTGRTVYYSIIDFVLSYSGNNSVINNIKNKWKKYNKDKDAIGSISTNEEWDDLFQNTDSIIANYAIYIHAKKGGAKGKKNYHWINANSSDSVLTKDIKDVAYCVAGGNASKYANQFYGRIMQQLNLIEDSSLNSDGSDDDIESDSATSNNQDDSREERSGDDPSKNRSNNTITPNIINRFPPLLKAKQIKFDLPPHEDQQKEIAKSLGNIPFVWYNSYQINYNDIDFLQLYTSNNLPSVKIVFRDSLNLMRDKGFPLDDSKISIFINPRSKELKEIHMDFKIIKFNINEGVYSITGVIDANKLYVQYFKVLPQMTSYNALIEITKEVGLGFNTNIDDTDDAMTWINTGQTIIDFVDDIVDTSYKSDETYLLSYIDFYYNLNYIDLEKELNRDINQELGISNIGIEDIINMQDQEKVSKLFLTNDFSMQNSNCYFTDYRIINNSTSVSLSQGYYTKIKFYDELKKDFLIFDIDSITSKGDKNIILKGAPQDELFYNDNNKQVYSGKLDVDNMHRNYHYSCIQNKVNISELQKIGIEISMKTPNYNLYRFQKMYVIISNQSSTPSSSHINNRLSGDWFIIDIMYKFDGSKYTQIIKLIKRELSLSPEELNNEPAQVKRNNDALESTQNDGFVENNEVVIDTTVADTVLDNNVEEDETFLMTKEIFRSIYKGKINEKVIEQYYAPMKKFMINYKINTKERIVAFLSQINIESNYLLLVSETDNSDSYKGRGLIRLTGKDRYKSSGDFLNKDFISNPNVVSSNNETHRKGASSTEQIENTILVSIWYWLNGSNFGNLNDYADKMDIRKSLEATSIMIEGFPNSQEDGKLLGNKKNNNYAVENYPNDINLNNLTLINFGIANGYDKYRERVKSWMNIREYFK
jgi:predicted chitinase